ncbi:unnamed protein product [Rhizoctonia solani]|uniref:Zn(2)-C6 fungal-type domain-containing protein n=1 Tax=Rhizoctonia solani TaxID=456999 RepID=A0A8H3AW72_9AGAM|nr:unnamed protein product [Rhizoctonia solani]
MCNIHLASLTHTMSIRSTTGCYACKSRHKKCDETKPRCLRCAKSGADCEYEYLTLTGKSTKHRTRQAPRPTNEQAKKLEKEKEKESHSLAISESQETHNACGLAGLFDHPLDPSLDMLLPSNTAWDTLLQQFPSASAPPQGAMFSFDPSITHAPSSLTGPSPVSQQSRLEQNLTTGQAVLFDALFSLGKANSSPQLISAPSLPLTYATANYSANVNLDHTSFGSYPSESHPGTAFGRELDSYLPPKTDEYEEYDGDIQGVKEVFCVSRISLNGSVESSALPFVLQSYARWIPRVFFDPLKVAHKTKEDLIAQFTFPHFRSRILLFSHIMSALAKSWVVDEKGKQMIEMIKEELMGSLASYIVRNNRHLASEAERQKANSALDNTLEVLGILVFSSPLAATLSILQLAAPAFIAACPPPHPPHLSSVLVDPRFNTRLFVALDILFSIATGRPMSCKYHVPWSLQLCDDLAAKYEDYGLRWLCGMPDQYAMLFAYMNELREDGCTTEGIIEQIEDDIRNIKITPVDSKDPALRVGRMVVQECWREVVFLYLYMALCGAPATDARVKGSVRSFIRLLKRTVPYRNTDIFMSIPMLIVGIACTKPSHRQIVCARILQIPNWKQPNSSGNDLFRILQDVWERTSLEGRASRWDDIREACKRVVGV